MLIIQLFVLGFSLAMLYKSWTLFADKKIEKSAFLFWVFVWGSLLMSSFLPAEVWNNVVFSVTFFNSAVVIVVAIILFYLFKLSQKIRKIERDIAKIVRKLAVENKK